MRRCPASPTASDACRKLGNEHARPRRRQPHRRRIAARRGAPRSPTEQQSEQREQRQPPHALVRARRPVPRYPTPDACRLSAAPAQQAAPPPKPAAPPPSAAACRARAGRTDHRDATRRAAHRRAAVKASEPLVAPVQPRRSKPQTVRRCRRRRRAIGAGGFHAATCHQPFAKRSPGAVEEGVGRTRPLPASRPQIEKVDIGNFGTFYSLQIGPFPDKAESLKVCNALKRSGIDCSLVTP